MFANTDPVYIKEQNKLKIPHKWVKEEMRKRAFSHPTPPDIKELRFIEKLKTKRNV